MAVYPPFQLRNLRRTLEARVPVKAARDLWSWLRYGRAGPLSDECLHVDPHSIELHYVPNPKEGAPRFRRASSGKILGGDWDLSVIPAGQNIKYQACLKRFRDGVPWEDTGLYEDMLIRIGRHGIADGCRTLEDIKARYAALDAVAEETRRARRLKTRKELDGAYFRREHGGVLVHIGRHGQLIRGGGGQHRFALAVALDLPVMPVQLGVIHRQAFDANVLARLRGTPMVDPDR